MLRDTAQDCSPLRVFYVYQGGADKKNDSSPPDLTLLGLSLLSDPA